jgi:cell division transport system ATP-binding protein
MRVFKRFQEVGVTVVIASHDPHLVEQFGQREIVLDAGRIATDTFHAGYAARMTAQAPQLSDLPDIHT